MWNDYTYRTKRGMTNIEMFCTGGEVLKAKHDNREELRYFIVYVTFLNEVFHFSFNFAQNI